MQEKRSKHIDIQYHYVRNTIEDDKIKPYYIDGARNPADILTKNLGQILFHQFHPGGSMNFPFNLYCHSMTTTLSEREC